MKGWRRFGIKAMLVVVLLISVPMAWLANERIKFAKCEKAITEMRTGIQHNRGMFIADFPDKHQRRFDQISGQSFSRIGIFSFSHFYKTQIPNDPVEVRSDHLYGIRSLYIKPAAGLPALSQFRQMPDLTELTLSFSNRTDLDIDELRHFKRIQKLKIGIADSAFSYPEAYSTPECVKLRELLPNTKIIFQYLQD